MNSKALKWVLVSLSALSPGIALGQQANLYPAQPAARLALDLDKGSFVFLPKTPADALNIEWVNTVASKDVSGAVKVIGVVAGKVGIPNENGEGLVCLGGERTRAYAKPSLMENGKISRSKVRALAYQYAVDACQAEGGSLVLEHGEVAIVHAHSQASQPLAIELTSKSAAKSQNCVSSEVQVKCDISVHAAEFSELYKKFRTEFPAHAVANDEVFDALR